MTSEARQFQALKAGCDRRKSYREEGGMAYVNVLEWGAHQVSEWLQGELINVHISARASD